jgi:hypothetical protein
VKRRRLPVVVLASCAVLAAAAIVPGGLVPIPEAGRPSPPGPLESDLDAESLELDRQLRSTAAHRELLQRLSADLIAGRRTLPAATVLADFSRQRKPAVAVGNNSLPPYSVLHAEGRNWTARRGRAILG